MSYYYGELNYVQIQEAIDKNSVIILPIGTTEEHGKHLPVETDAMIAKYVGDKLGAACQEAGIPVLVMRTIHYGFSMSVVRKWPGCPNINTRTFMDYIYSMVESLIKEGFRKIVLLTCHGNHDSLLRTVMREIADAHNVYIMTLAPFALAKDTYERLKKDPEGDIHGGEYETSCMLHIAPELVDTSAYTNVDAIRCNTPLRGPVSTWGLQKTQTGLFGDPTYATAELGKACLEAAVEKGVEYIKAYYEHNEQS
ncbi:MAG: creatininase family protein [Caldicoprobacterales bacterium]|jgi:creatinine amidohydrolase|nr:creatininase family protein [Clostridiales bacterium]